MFLCSSSSSVLLEMLHAVIQRWPACLLPLPPPVYQQAVVPQPLRHLLPILWLGVWRTGQRAQASSQALCPASAVQTRPPLSRGAACIHPAALHRPGQLIRDIQTQQAGKQSVTVSHSFPLIHYCVILFYFVFCPPLSLATHTHTHWTSWESCFVKLSERGHYQNTTKYLFSCVIQGLLEQFNGLDKYIMDVIWEDTLER